MNQIITPITNLLVIDSQVSDWQGLASAATAGTAVLILNSGSDGLTQISDYLTTLAASTADFIPLQSIQIMSHGSAGTLLLGSSTITQDNLSSYSEQLASMGSSLSSTGDILLYGCDVAADQNGVDFINQLAVLTNADVAASNNLTGSAALAGDWQLEASTGTIDSGLALNTEAVNSYANTLSIKVKDNLLSEAYLSVYDSTQALTFVLDLGLTMGDLVANLSNNDFSKSYDLTALTAASTDGKWSTFAANLNTETTVFGVLTSGNGGRLLATGPAISPEKFATITVAAAAVTTSANHIASVNTAALTDNTGVAVDTALNLSAIISDSDTPDTGQHDQRNSFTSLNGGKTDAGASINYGTAGNFYYYSGGATQIVTQAVQTWSLDATTGMLTYSKVAAANNAPTGAVTITGTATQNEVLTADISTLTDADGLGTIAYQWLADGTAITNGTTDKFTLTQAQVNKVITVQASYTDGLNNLEKVLSSATTAVVDVNDAPTGTVTISGLLEQNQILTAANTLGDLDGMGTVPIAYQWFADGVVITNATAETFTLTQAQVNKVITVQASYTDGLNKLEKVLSSATTAVANVNDAPTGTVTISGLLEQNQILTAANTLGDLDGMGTVPIAYQWFA
ncbi:DUF4347 domain-containing protein, partial [Methylobacter psychrophilus]|uniref:DUF4347 domain-containing protein n=1 Tax=Methylobacter psychrophilus TaxID=96941 RepID=UPI0021D4EF26